MHLCPKKTNYLSKLQKFPSKKPNFPPVCKISGEGDSPIPHFFPALALILGQVRVQIQTRDDPLL